MKMKICPRCKRKCLEEEDVLNAISHIGSKISICSVCGQEQGKVGMGLSDDIVEIEMENRFKESLK
jgi:hypothetical protein